MKAQEILDALSTSDIVLEMAVIVLVQEPGRQALRAIASLENTFSTSMRLTAETSEATLTMSGKVIKWYEGGTMRPTGPI